MSRAKVSVGPNSDLLREPGSAVTLYVHCLALSHWQNRGSMGLLFDNFGDVLRTKFDSKVDSGELLLGDAHFVRVKKPEQAADRKLWVCNLMCLTISQRKVMINRAALSTALSQLGLFLTTRDVTLPTTIHFIIPRGVEFDLSAATPAAAAAAFAALSTTTNPASTTPPLSTQADLPTLVALMQKLLLVPRDNVEVYAQAPSADVAKVLTLMFEAVSGGRGDVCGGGGDGSGEKDGEQGGAATGGAVPDPTLVMRDDAGEGGAGGAGAGVGGVEPTLRMGDGGGVGGGGEGASGSLQVVGAGGGDVTGGGGSRGGARWKVLSSSLAALRPGGAVGELFGGVRVCVLGHATSGVRCEAVIGAIANVLQVAPPTVEAMSMEANAVVECLAQYKVATRSLPVKGQMGEAEGGGERCVVVLPLLVRGDGDEEEAVKGVAAAAARVCGWEVSVEEVGVFVDASYCSDLSSVASRVGQSFGP